MKKRKFGIGRISNNPKKTGTFFHFIEKSEQSLSVQPGKK